MKVLVIGEHGQLASSFKKIDTRQQLVFLGKEKFDFTQRSAVNTILDTINPELIINCAAYTAVDLAQTEKDKCQKLNVDFISYLADWCSQQDCKLIHFSTDYVFDGTNQGEYQEKDIPAPLNWYGETKAMGEQYLKNSSVQALIFRISWVYSEFGNNFVKTMIRLGKEKTELSIVSDQVGSPCYAVNVAEVIYHWIFNRNLQGFEKGIYHLVPKAQMSWYEFAEKIFSTYRKYHSDLKIVQLKPIATADYKTAAQRPLNSRLNSQKSEMKLGLSLEDFASSLDRVIKSL